MVTTVRPKASETPSRPMPTCGKAAASTALPQPPSTSQNVPIASAAYFLPFMNDSLALFRIMQTRQRQLISYAMGGQNDWASGKALGHGRMSYHPHRVCFLSRGQHQG